MNTTFKFKISYEPLLKLFEERGYNSYYFKRTGLIGQQTYSNLKKGTGGVDDKTLARLCVHFDKKPGDLIKLVRVKE